MRSCGRLAVAASLTVLAASPSADAATLASEENPQSTPEHGWLLYRAAAGESNRLVVTEAADRVTLHDPGATIQVENACDLADPHTAVCRRDKFEQLLLLEVDLADGDDSARTDLLANGAFDDPDIYGGTPVKLRGGDGADELTGSDFAREHKRLDDLDGGPGDDILFGRAGMDFVLGGPGIDRLDAGPEDDRLDGGPGGDVMNGGHGFDQFQGRGHNAVPEDDADLFLGGENIDSVNYMYRFVGERGWEATEPELRDLRVTGDGLANDGAAGEGDRFGPDVEGASLGEGNDYFETGDALRGGGGWKGDDVYVASSNPPRGEFSGGPGDDVMTGGSGQDTLTGQEGNDRIVGGAGFDFLNGDAGDDWIDSRDPFPPGGWTGDNTGHDRLDCGEGFDEVYPDRSEVSSMIPTDGCDYVHDPPVEPVIPVPQVPWLDNTGVAREETVSVVVGCPADAVSCTSTLVLSVPGVSSRLSASKSKRVVMARGKVVGKRAKRRRVSIPLTKAGRALVRRRSRIEALARMQAAPKGSRVSKTRLVLKRR